MNSGPKDHGRGGYGGRGSRRRSEVVTTTTTTTTTTRSSAEHRRKLEAMFSGGEKVSTTSVPQTKSRERVFSSPRKSIGRGPSEYRMRLERLRIVLEPEQIREATDAFLAHHQLPDDADVLL